MLKELVRPLILWLTSWLEGWEESLQMVPRLALPGGLLSCGCAAGLSEAVETGDEELDRAGWRTVARFGGIQLD
jgi:hypothetical protein